MAFEMAERSIQVLQGNVPVCQIIKCDFHIIFLAFTIFSFSNGKVDFRLNL